LLKPRRKLKKRQIKEDKLVTAYFKAQDWLRENTRLLGYIGIGVVVVALIVVLVVRSERSAEDKASVELARAELLVDQGKNEDAIAVLESLVDRYGGTSAARLALLDLANTYYQQGEFDLAIKYFDQYIKKHSGYDPLLTASAIAGKASCLEAKGQYEEAAKLFVQAAEKNPDGFNAPEYLMNAAFCYEHLQRWNEAEKLYKRILDEYPKSTVRNDVEMALARVEVEKAKATTSKG